MLDPRRVRQRRPPRAHAQLDRRADLGDRPPLPPVQAPQSDSDTPPAAGDTRNTPGSRAPDASATRVAVAVASLAARAIGPAAGGRRDVRLEASDRRILDALARVGRASAGELAAALGGKPAKRTIERRFKVLAAARMVRSVPDGRTVRWELA